jgi:hypothetical protein
MNMKIFRNIIILVVVAGLSAVIAVVSVKKADQEIRSNVTEQVAIESENTECEALQAMEDSSCEKTPLWVYNNSMNPVPPCLSVESEEECAVIIETLVEDIPECGPFRREKKDLKGSRVEDIIQTNTLDDNGYRIEDICHDPVHPERIAFILAKEEKNLIMNRPDAVCRNNCDRIVFGVADLKYVASHMIISDHRLGIYSEAYNQDCVIYSFRSNLPHNLEEEEINFSCRTGENPDWLKWLSYRFVDDNLEESLPFYSIEE